MRGPRAQTWASCAGWLPPTANLGPGLGCGPSQNFWAICSTQQAGFRGLPLESGLFFLSNCLCQAATPPSEETGYLVSDVVIFLKEFLGSLNRATLGAPVWLSR